MSYESEVQASPESSGNPGKVRQLQIAEDEAGQRVDNYLLRQLKGVPRSRIYRIVRKGEVRINGKRVKPEQRLAAGDRVRIPPVRQSAQPEPGTGRVPARLIEAVRRAIVHEDADLLVVNKPSGLATHGGSGIDFGVIEALRAGRPEESLELVHRLDRDTSGCLLIARRRSRLRELHALLREGEVEKRYLALVMGHWPHGEKTVDAPLVTHQRQGGERVVKVGAAGKEAASVFRPVQFFGKRAHSKTMPLATLMDVELKTGRTHQIRVHATHEGHPVAGDEKYGDKEFNETLRKLGLKRMFLHAQMLNFTWPSGKDFSVSVPLDEELKAVLDEL